MPEKRYDYTLPEKCSGELISFVETGFKTSITVSHNQHEHKNSPYILVNSPWNECFLAPFIDIVLTHTQKEVNCC